MTLRPLLASLAYKLALALALCGHFDAQGAVWIVDDDGGAGVDFTVLQDAIDAASDGDVILLQTGTYDPRPAFPPSPTTIDGKSVVISAEAGAQPLISEFLVRNTAADQPVTLRGLAFDRATVFEDCAGVIWLEDATLSVANFAGNTLPLLVDSCDAVHINRCHLEAGQQIVVRPAGLSAVGSNLHITDSTLIGANGYGGSEEGGDGLELSGGFLFASNSTFQGGSSGCGAAGLRLYGANPTADTFGCTIQAGAAAICVGVQAPDVFVVSGTHNVLSGTPRTLDVQSPVHSGANCNVTFEGQPGDRAYVAATPNPSATYYPKFRGVLQLSLAHQTFFFGVLPASGKLTVPVPVPTLAQPSLTLYLQAAFVSTAGKLVLSGGSALVMLN